MVFGIEMEKIPTETAKISFMQLKVHAKVFQSTFDEALLHFSLKTADFFLKNNPESAQNYRNKLKWIFYVKYFSNLIVRFRIFVQKSISDEKFILKSRNCYF